MKRTIAPVGYALALLLAVTVGCTQQEESPPAKAPAKAADVTKVSSTPIQRAPVVDDEPDDPNYPEDFEELYVDLEGEPDEGPPPLTVKWESIVEDGTAPFTYLWEFGDGTPPSTEANPTHTYEREGDFTTVLKVKDSKGLWGSEEYDIIVENE